MMQQMDLLFNNAATCTLTSANTTATPQPLDFSCVAGGGGDPLALNASPTGTPENPFADAAVEEPAIGSGSGIAQLEKVTSSHTTTVNVANNVNFARSSRGLASSDYAGLNFVAYAQDGIGWFHFLSTPNQNQTTTTNYSDANTAGSSTTVASANVGTIATPSSCITSMTQAQLKSIYNGTYTTWGQVDPCVTGAAATAPIVVFSAQTGSGTQAQFKTYLGIDPTSSSNPVNCVSSTCGGPITIFENELSQMNTGAFLAGNQTSFLNSIPAVAGNASNTLVKNYSTTTTKLQMSKNGKVLYVTNAFDLAVGSTIKVGNTVEHVTAFVPKSTSHLGVVTPAKVTVDTGVPAIQAIGTAVTWTESSNSTAAYTSASKNDALRADAIFFYSYGKWKYQTGTNGAVSQIAAVNCAAHDCGAANLPAGYTATLGNEDSVNINDANVLNGTWTDDRYLFNVYSNGSNNKIAAAASPATLNYVSEAGFICKPQNSQIVDPNTGRTYLNEIQATISAQGFFPISNGAASGTVNTTPVADEGSVATPVAKMNLVSSEGDYSQYMNVPAGTAATPSANNAGIANGTFGGYASSNGDPSGFCLVSSTTGNAA
jgi:hypothetical protein